MASGLSLIRGAHLRRHRRCTNRLHRSLRAWEQPRDASRPDECFPRSHASAAADCLGDDPLTDDEAADLAPRGFGRAGSEPALRRHCKIPHATP